MKLVESQFASQDKSAQSLTAQNEVLNKNIDAQKNKIETLRSALENASSSFGENDRRTQSWAVQLNNAETQLNKMERELEDNITALKDTDKGMDSTGKAAEDMGDEVEEAGKKSDSAGDKFKTLGTVCKAAAATMAAAFTAVSAASIAAGKALINMTTEGAAYADSVMTEAHIMGISTEKLQEYMYAAELVDVSTETITKSLAKQIKSMKAAQDGSKLAVEAYEKLGVEVMNADGSLRESEDVYWEVIDALGEMTNETERDAIGMQLLGKSAQELKPLITAGASAMAELGEQAHKAGYVVSGEMLEAYGKLDDQIQYLKVGTVAAKNALGGILLPVLTDLAGEGVDLLGEFTRGILGAGGDIGKMGDVISSVLPKLLNTIMDYVPLILELIGSVLSAVGKAIVDNLPMIVSSATKIILSILEGLILALPKIAEGTLLLVKELAKGILNNLPLIFQTAIEVIATLATGIADSLPMLIPTIISVIIQVCNTLIENLPTLLSALLQIIKGLAQGILDALPVIIAALPSIINGIIDFLIMAIPEIIDTGIALLVSLVDALPTIIQSIVEALPRIIDGIINGVLGAIPQIIEAGIMLLVSLIQALPTIILTIVNALPQIISGIVNAVVQNIPLIVKAGIELLTSLIKNLPIIIKEIVKAMPQIITGIVSSLGQGVKQLADVGKNLVKGLWEGIQSLATWLWDKVSDWAKGLWDGICSFFGIKSPSKKFAELGKNLSLGLGVGFVDEMKNVDKDITRAIPTDFDINARTQLHSVVADRSFDAHSYAGRGVFGNSSEQIVVEVPLYLDGKLITSHTSAIQSTNNRTYKRALGVV